MNKENVESVDFFENISSSRFRQDMNDAFNYIFEGINQKKNPKNVEPI